MGQVNFRHSDEAVETVKDIVSESDCLESVSDFYKTMTDFALERATEDQYNPVVPNYDKKVEELGLEQSSPEAFDHYDFTTAVFHVTRDEHSTNEEKIEYLKKISEEELTENFSDSYYERWLD